MKTALLFVLLLLLARTAFADAPVNAVAVIDKPAAILGNSVIWTSEVEQRLDEAKLQNQPSDRATVLEGLIDERLMLARARQLHIEVGSDELDQALDQIKTQNSLTDSQLDAMLAKVHMTRAAYRQQLAVQLVLLKLASVEWRGKLDVTAAEIAAEVAARKLTNVTDDMKVQIKTQLFSKKLDAAQKAWLTERKQGVKIERRP